MDDGTSKRKVKSNSGKKDNASHAGHSEWDDGPLVPPLPKVRMLPLGYICSIEEITDVLGVSDNTVTAWILDGCESLDAGQKRRLFNTTSVAEYLAMRTAKKASKRPH